MNDGTIVDIPDLKLLPCCECCIHSLGWFAGVWILRAGVTEHYVCFIFIGRVNKTYENGTECSETSAYKIQKPWNHLKERIWPL